MTSDDADWLSGGLKPSLYERRFEEFLKRQQLHFTQSECGLGWVQRNVSYADNYRQSVGLDVVDPHIRAALPSTIGGRSLFRFMMPRSEATPPHLVISGQQLCIPGMNVQLPKNPDLELDIGGLLMMIKAQALRSYRALDIEPVPNQITLLMAIWFGWHWLGENSHEPEHTVPIPTQMIQWLSGLVPPYLCVVKWVWPQRFKDLSLGEAQEAAGIPARRLANLYPMQENTP